MLKPLQKTQRTLDKEVEQAIRKTRVFCKQNWTTALLALPRILVTMCMSQHWWEGSTLASLMQFVGCVESQVHFPHLFRRNHGTTLSGEMVQLVTQFDRNQTCSDQSPLLARFFAVKLVLCYPLGCLHYMPCADARRGRSG
jgi:hypothetical protein